MFFGLYSFFVSIGIAWFFDLITCSFNDDCSMFGVGFYSVFALTESPIVRSGAQSIQFFWYAAMCFRIVYIWTGGNLLIIPYVCVYGFRDANHLSTRKKSWQKAEKKDKDASDMTTEIVLNCLDRGENVMIDMKDAATPKFASKSKISASSSSLKRSKKDSRDEQDDLSGLDDDVAMAASQEDDEDAVLQDDEEVKESKESSSSSKKSDTSRIASTVHGFVFRFVCLMRADN